MRIITAYHGTNARFSKFEQSKARIANDYYGGGVAYATDSIAVAKTYANAMARRFGGDKFIYEIELKMRKMFDVDQKYTGDTLRKLVGNDAEVFARGAGLLKLGANRSEVLGSLRDGSVVMTGEQVFKGLSNGMVHTAKAREKLISAGFDGLRYNGGVNMSMATRHNVYLVYSANDIVIKKRFIISPTPVSSTAHKETYTFIN